MPATGLRRDGLRLLQELCSAARLVRPGVRAAFFNALYQSEPNVLSSVESVVRDPTACARHVVISMDVLFALMQQDPARLRAHILAQKNHPPPPASIAVASTPGAKPIVVKPTVRHVVHLCIPLSIPGCVLCVPATGPPRSAGLLVAPGVSRLLCSSFPIPALCCHVSALV